MLKALNKITFDQILFLIVTLIGAYLISYEITDAPLTYDEFSVVHRASFDTLKEVYLNTQETDVHPPLMLFFLFYWLKIAGTNVVLIKLPFVLAGIFSMFLIYKIAKNWFSTNTAILSIAFLSSIQFTITYSQLARPYIFGLFLCLLFAYFWTKIVQNKNSHLNSIAYIFTATLCIYNHHYSLLQVVAIGFSGLFLIKKTHLIHYLILNVILCVLFLPNLIMMLSQIGYDGMTYIPEADFKHVFRYFAYIFQFSIVPFIIVFGIIAFTLFKNKKALTNKYTFIALSWFLVPLVIGIIISNLIRPVMPIRALIFSFPFLIIFLFSFIKKINKSTIVAFIILIIGTNIYGLVIHRNHYQSFQYDIGTTSVKNINYLIENKLVKNPSVFYNYPEANIRFYWDKFLSNYSFESPYENREKDSYKPTEFRAKIANLNNDALILCNMPIKMNSIAKEYFPYLIYKDLGSKYCLFCFSKNKPSNTEEPYFSSSIDFESESENLEREFKNIVIDSNTSNHYYRFNDGNEWGPLLEINLGKIIKNNSCIIEAKAAILSSNKNHDGHLVFEVVNDDKGVVWYSSPLSDYLSKKDQWQNIYFTDQLNILEGSEKINKSSVLRVYFWNKEKKAISIDNLSISISEGNHLVYSLTYDFSK